MNSPTWPVPGPDPYTDGMCVARDHIARLEHFGGLLDRDTVLAELRALIDQRVFGATP